MAMQNHNKEYSTVDSIVESISTSLQGKKPFRFPSLSVLAKQFGVSVRTMNKVAATLKHQGLVHISRGRKMSTPDYEQPQQRMVHTKSVDSLYTTILDAIAAGRYKYGTAFPKIYVLQKQHHRSARTICQALQRLASHGYIHKKGKSWIVGKPSADRRYMHMKPPVIFILHAKPSRWKSIDSQWSTEFYRTFNHECESLGFRANFYVSSKDQSYNNAYPWGQESVISDRKKLGERYQGMLIVGAAKEYEDFDSWLKTAFQLKRPVVWFLTHGNDTYKTSRLSQRPILYRCSFSEHNFEYTALKYLVDWGHRDIAFLYDSSMAGQHERAKRLSHMCRHNLLIQSTEIGNTFPVNIRFLPCDINCLKTAQATFSDKKTALSVCNTVTHHEKQSNQESCRWVTWIGPCAFALNHGCTAILAANDIIATRIRIATRHLNLSLPDFFSLLSFDNTPRSLLQRVSSVDPGFSSLAYRAFHSLSGYVPITCDKSGLMQTKAFVADRGSVGIGPYGEVV